MKDSVSIPKRVQRIHNDPQLMKNNDKSVEVYSFQMMEHIPVLVFEEAFDVTVLNTNIHAPKIAFITNVALTWSDSDNTYIIRVSSPDCADAFLQCNNVRIGRSILSTTESVFYKYKEIVFTILKGIV